MKSTRNAILVVLLVLAGFSGVRAQDPDTIEVTTELVNVSVTVTDRQGRPLGNLSKDDFVLYDNGELTDIAFFSGRDAPISYGIVYDLHPTTARQSKSILEALEAFTGGLGDNEDFFLTIFNEYGSLSINFIPTAEQVARHLSFGERNEPNSLYDAVYLAGMKLRERANQKKTLIIISDGKDHQSHHGFKELERLFESFSVQIYAVILGNRDVWDYNELAIGREPSRLEIDESELDAAAIKKLSAESGGIAATPARNAVNLYAIFEKLSDEMRGRYSLGFYPAGAGPHTVRIELKSADRKKHKLSYRKSYVISETR